MSELDKKQVAHWKKCFEEVGLKYKKLEQEKQKALDELHLEQVVVHKQSVKIKILLKCAKFYAAYSSWGNSGNKNINRIKTADGSEETFEIDGFTHYKVKIGGKLARETVKEIE